MSKLVLKIFMIFLFSSILYGQKIDSAQSSILKFFERYNLDINYLSNYHIMIYYMDYQDILTCNQNIYPGILYQLQLAYPKDSLKSIIIVGNLNSKNIEFFKKVMNHVFIYNYLIIDEDNQFKNLVGINTNICYLLYDKNFKFKSRVDSHNFDFSSKEVPAYYNNYQIPFKLKKLPSISETIISPNKIEIYNNTIYISDPLSYSVYTINLKDTNISKQINILGLGNAKFKQLIDTKYLDSNLNKIMKFNKDFKLSSPQTLVNILIDKNKYWYLTEEIDTFNFYNKSMNFVSHYYIHNTDNPSESEKIEQDDIPENFLETNGSIIYIDDNNNLVLTNKKFKVEKKIILEGFKNSQNYSQSFLAVNNNSIFIINPQNNIFYSFDINKYTTQYHMFWPSKFLSEIFTLEKLKYDSLFTNLIINSEIQNIFANDSLLFIFFRSKDNSNNIIEVYNLITKEKINEFKLSFFIPENKIESVYFIKEENNNLLFLVKYSKIGWNFCEAEITAN
ncbi:MAG: hypothetical protein ACPL1A_05860 [Candidatus Kapaibacteriota bacterium]